MAFRINRSHEQIGDEADDQQSGHDEHGGVVGLGFGHSSFNLGGGDVIDQVGPKQRGDGPRRDEASVNGADLVGAKHVAQICWDGGKASAIHGDDDCRDDDEERFVLDVLRPGHDAIQERTEEEVDAINRLTTGVVGNG